MQSVLLYLFLFSLPFERLLTFEVGGYTLKLSYLFGLLLLIYSFRSKYLLILKKLEFEDLCILLFLLLSFLSLFWSLDPKRTLFISLLSAFSILIYLLFKRLSFDKGKVIEILIWLGLAASLFGLWQFFGDSYGLPQSLTFLRSQYLAGVFPFPRIQSTFLEPLFFANFLLLPIYLSVSRYIKSQNRKYLILLLIISLAFFLTLSRGALYGLIGSLVVVFFMVLIYSKKCLLAFIHTLVFLGISFLLSLFLIFVVSQKAGLSSYLSQAQKTTDQNVTASGTQELTLRSYTERVALNTSKKHPFGIGNGAFGNLPEFKPVLGTGNHQTVNNEYLEVLVETGIIGFILLVLFWGATLLRAFEFSRQDIFGIFFFGILVSWLIQYLSFSAFNLLYLWAMLGFISNYSRKTG